MNKEEDEIIIEIIDVEEYAKLGKEIPRNKKYKIRIDKDTFIVHVECMTGKEILELAKKLPVQKYQLNMKLRGGEVKKVTYDEKVCFHHNHVERFMTLPLDPTEGGAI